MERLRLKLWLIVGLLLLLGHGAAIRAAPVGTGFTYQGRLTDANQPADGLYDFRFKLFDGLTDGNQVGITVDVNNVDVIDGYFTVGLDFGGDPNIFNGQARWLEIGVRPGELNDPNEYLILNPRQEVKPTPYALYALSSGTGPGPMVGGSGTDNYIPRWLGTNNLENSVIYQTDAGKVGIGTTIPQTVFDVHGGRIRASQGFESIYGTSAAVSIGFINDNDTGMFTPEENSVAFSTNGRERLTIDASGNVGIGTYSPGAKLEVNGQVKITGGSPGPGKVLTSIDAAGLANWQTPVSPAGDNLGNHIATQNIQLNGHYLSGDGGNEGVYVANDGKVGIGTTSPQQVLDLGSATSGRAIVWGGPGGANWFDTIGASYSSAALSLLFNLRTDTTKDQYLVSYTGTYPHTGIRIHDGIYFFAEPLASRTAGDVFDYPSATRLYIKGDGNVGIGTTSPTAKLQVTGTTLVSNGGIETIFGTAGTPGYRFMGTGVNTGMFAPAANELAFSTNSAERMRINSAGNVGIGTKSPARPLEVNPTTANDNPIRFSRGGGETTYGELIAGADGIGIAVRNASTGVGIQFYTSTGTSDSERMRIDNIGNVGIAVQNPYYRLQLPNQANPGGGGLANTWDEYSSRKWKTNIEPIGQALEKVKKLQGVYFDWKENGKHDIGLIAEEVADVIPEVVGYGEDGKSPESLDYGRLVSLLIEAVKEQQAKIDTLEKALEKQKSLEERITAMETTIRLLANSKEVQQ